MEESEYPDSPGTQDEIEVDPGVWLDQEFKRLLEEMRPLICTLDRECSVSCMSWLRLLSSCGATERERRNQLMTELRTQLVCGHVQQPFCDLAPVRDAHGLIPAYVGVGSVRGSETSKILSEVDDSSQWSDVTGSTITEATARSKQPADVNAKKSQRRVISCVNVGARRVREWTRANVDVEAVMSASRSSNGANKSANIACTSANVGANTSAWTGSNVGANTGMGDARITWQKHYLSSDAHSACTSVYADSVVSGSVPDTPTSVIPVSRSVPDSHPESPARYNALTMQIYQETIQHLRQDLIREKTNANCRINALNHDVRTLTKKVDVMEKCRATVERCRREDVDLRRKQLETVLLSCWHRLSSAQEMNKTTQAAVQRLEQAAQDVASGFVSADKYAALLKDISEIREEYERSGQQREKALRAKNADLRKTIRKFVAAKQMWAEAYEKRIECAEVDKNFEVQEMQLKMMWEKQEHATNMAKVEVSKLEDKYKVLLADRDAAALKTRQEQVQRILELEQLLEKATQCEKEPVKDVPLSS